MNNPTNPGAALAALRKTETKPCQDCGEPFTGLIKKTMCNKCVDKHKKRRKYARMKTQR